MPAGSSPLTGSSSTSSSGSQSRQRATPSRWRMPSEYVLTLSSRAAAEADALERALDAPVRGAVARGGVHVEVLAAR